MERSQAELHDALAETPGDPEFMLAIKENNASIERRRALISETKLLLQAIDPVYYLEHYNSTRQTINVPHIAEEKQNETLPDEHPNEGLYL